MMPESIARRYAHRPGFKLVAYAEVVLPIYRLRVRVITLDHKSIPPIEEFLLKCIKAEINSIADIGSFLGLTEKVVRAGLTNLLCSEDILPVVASRGHHFKLTQKGENTICNAEVVTPEEHEIPIHFDCLLRKPALYEKDTLYSRRSLRDTGFLEIPAWPPTRPQLSDLPVQEMNRIIQEAARLREYKRHLIAIRSIEKYDRMGRYAIALVYRAKENNEINIAFAIGGKVVDELEGAFASQRGPQRLGIDRLLADSGSRDFIRELPEDILREVPPEAHIETLEKQQTDAEAAIDAAKQELERAGSENARTDAETRLREASLRFTQAQSALDEIPIRFLSVYDHPRVLERAIEESTQRLMIVSPWTGLSVVSDQFINSLKKTLERGVKVYIAYGLGKEGKHNRRKSDAEAEARLKSLASQYPNFKLKLVGNTHAKVLLYDSKQLALGSFNWLSFRGDPESTFRDEQGVLISKPELVDEKFLDQIKQHFDGVE
jgi:hypothetical protein